MASAARRAKPALSPQDAHTRATSRCERLPRWQATSHMGFALRPGALPGGIRAVCHDAGGAPTRNEIDIARAQRERSRSGSSTPGFAQRRSLARRAFDPAQSRASWREPEPGRLMRATEGRSARAGGNDAPAADSRGAVFQLGALIDWRRRRGHRPHMRGAGARRRVLVFTGVTGTAARRALPHASRQRSEPAGALPLLTRVAVSGGRRRRPPALSF
jgi:hypothetical protein